MREPLPIASRVSYWRGAYRLLALLAASACSTPACGARTQLGDDGGVGGSALETVASTTVASSTTATTVVSVSSAASTSVSTGSSMGCEDPDTLLVYVITEAQHLYRFDPLTGAFTFVGTVECGAPPDVTPYSMAVSRTGVAYVLFTDGEIFRVEISDATCEPTDFEVGQQGFDTFGMGFSSNLDDGTETLFVAESNFDTPSLGLASIDTTTLELDFIGPFSTTLGRSELTGTGDGKLFAFSLSNPGPGGEISEIDKATATVVSQVHIPVGDPQNAFAYASWGGSFYLFTALVNDGTTFVNRFDPGDMSITLVASLNDEIVVGAGVSTCAPS